MRQEVRKAIPREVGWPHGPLNEAVSDAPGRVQPNGRDVWKGDVEIPLRRRYDLDHVGVSLARHSDDFEFDALGRATIADRLVPSLLPHLQEIVALAPADVHEALNATLIEERAPSAIVSII